MSNLSDVTDEDATLGGYFRRHDRPPAFEGPDGHPYTVSLETEKTGNLRAPYQGYLVFPRWAETGVGIVGHVETPTLVLRAARSEFPRAVHEAFTARLRAGTLLELAAGHLVPMERPQLVADAVLAFAGPAAQRSTG